MIQIWYEIPYRESAVDDISFRGCILNKKVNKDLIVTGFLSIYRNMKYPTWILKLGEMLLKKKQLPGN